MLNKEFSPQTPKERESLEVAATLLTITHAFTPAANIQMRFIDEIHYRVWVDWFRNNFHFDPVSRETPIKVEAN
jgi:hypothetical protein